ncbi:MAG: glyoxalase [Candidatus Tectomicrobia bacterium]|uniref:Glyoxalase n=1 Tax=Tectimicrobiota bacterium TaxID=2528274 RepID=A0A938B3F7_UNCTE|nr:glyoxalase [Candidatus Tectomicrobia bacterium]
MIQLKRLGHVLLRVADVERSKAFYSGVLGFEVVEEDPAHGGVFMTLGEYGHTLDLFPVENPATAQKLVPNRLGVHHFAFQVESYADLQDAYFTLKDHGIEEIQAVDHVSQQSIYFHDPDGNRVEIYYELPNALTMFREGREDRDTPFTFEREG